MKKVYLLFAFLVVGLSAKAAPGAAIDYRNPFGYGDAFIFTEGGVEFALFPNGEFDFYFNPRSIVPGFGRHTPFSFNGGYNYDPFVQYDDYGAVIQIERVPIYYDHFGRIIRAGRIQIGYNHYGMVNRIGNMFLQYDPYNSYTRYSGYINSHNRFYRFRPWHEFYSRPGSYTIVYNQPYRRYYVPQRYNYNTYKKYYKQNSRTDFRRNYYTPGDRVTTYYRGSRSEDERELKKTTPADVRSNRNSNRKAEIQQTRPTRSSTVRRNTSEINNTSANRPVRSHSTQTRSTASQPTASFPEARSATTTSRRSVPEATTSESTSRSRSSRGRE